MTNNRNSAELANYRLLVSRVDELTARISSRFAAQIACRPGCSSCCRHLTFFPVEAAALAAALTELPASSRQRLHLREETGLDGPCPLLHDSRCLAYNHRPIICRTHGLPLLAERDGAEKIDYCPENFRDITSLPGDGVINLEVLNRTLVAINAQFVNETAEHPFLGEERFSMADIVRMAYEKTAPEGENK